MGTPETKKKKIKKEWTTTSKRILSLSNHTPVSSVCSKKCKKAKLSCFGLETETDYIARVRSSFQKACLEKDGKSNFLMWHIDDPPPHKSETGKTPPKYKQERKNKKRKKGEGNDAGDGDDNNRITTKLCYYCADLPDLPEELQEQAPNLVPLPTPKRKEHPCTKDECPHYSDAKEKKASDIPLRGFVYKLPSCPLPGYSHGKCIQVCRPMFCEVFHIDNKVVDRLLTDIKEGKRSCHRKEGSGSGQGLSELQQKQLKDTMNSYERCHSHYQSINEAKNRVR
jgi:hypothetical protein